MSVCLSVTTLVARELISAVQAWCQRNQYDTSKVFNSWISLKALCSKVMASFTSSIGATIYEVLLIRFLLVSKCHETETSTFDRITVQFVEFWLCCLTVVLSCDGKILTGLKLASVTQVSER